MIIVYQNIRKLELRYKAPISVIKKMEDIIEFSTPYGKVYVVDREVNNEMKILDLKKEETTGKPCNDHMEYWKAVKE